MRRRPYDTLRDVHLAARMPGTFLNLVYQKQNQGEKMRILQKKTKYLIRLSGIILCILMAVSVTLPVYAMGRQVYDDAGLFSDTEVEGLSAAVDEAESETGWDLMLLTVNDASVASTQNYAEEKFNEYHESDDGIAFVLDMNARVFYIATAGEAYKYIVDSRLNEMLDDATEYAAQGDYKQAMLAMMEDTVTFYQEGKPDDLTIYNEDTGIYYKDQARDSGPLLSGVEVLFAALAGGAACLIFCLFITGKYRLKFGRYHYNAREHGSVDLHRREDHFVRQFVTRRKIPKDSPPSSGGGTSTVHQGAGGQTFGGGGRGF